MSELLTSAGYLAIGFAIMLLAVAGATWALPRLLTTPAPASPGPDEKPEVRKFNGLDSWDDPNAPEPSPTAPVSRPPLYKILTLVGCASLLAAGIVFQGQLWTNPVDLKPLWWMLVVGAAFAIVARLGLSDLRPKRAAVDDADEFVAVSTDWYGELGVGAEDEDGEGWTMPAINVGLVAVLIAAFAAEAVSLGLFGWTTYYTTAWLAHAVACLIFVIGLWAATGATWRSIAPTWTLTDTISLAAILLLAFLARIWRDGSIPEGLWFDEADRGLDAIRILTERYLPPVYAPTFIQEPVGIRYLIVPLVGLFGREPLALRFPVVLLGTLGVGGIYLLARVLYGWRVAVVAAGLAIGFVWHLNFSRIALPAIPSLTCDTIAVVLLIYGMRSGNRFVLAAAGVVAAAGQYFYFSSELMLVVLALVGLHQLIAGRTEFLRRNFAGLALFIAGFVIAVGPVGQVAIRDFGQFNSRAQTVSIFNEVNQAGNWSPLINNIKTHLLMFDVRGDPNGRHNWSGRPMLDPVTGGLAIAGLALALVRFWRIEFALPLLWLPIATLGGALSLSFEAPQTHRSIDAIVPSLLFAALPLGLLWHELDRITGGLRVTGDSKMWEGFRREPLQIASCAAVVLILLGTNVVNLRRYFTQQQPDSRTWLEMQAPQTIAGRQIVGLPSGLRVYLEPSWVGSPSIRFLVANPHPYAPFDLALDLPIVDPSAAIFLGDQRLVAERIAALYPGATRLYTQMPEPGTIGGFGFVIPEEVLQASRGVTAHYQSGSSVIDRREPALDLDWRTAPPVPAPFSGTFTATLSVPTFGEYQFALTGPSTATLTLDGVDVVSGGKSGTLHLARGNHALRVQGTDLGREPLRLLWGFQAEPPHAIEPRFLNVAPFETTGLYARLYNGVGVSGTAAAEQVDPNVDLHVHFVPLQRPYTTEWAGALRADVAGDYRFGLGSIGESTIWIDDVQVAQNTTPNGYAEAEAKLERGWHDIRIRFVDQNNFSFVTAFWQPPGGGREAIPTSALRPWPASRVAAARPEDNTLPILSGSNTRDEGPRVTLIAPPEAPTNSADLRDLGDVKGATGLAQPRGLASSPDGTLFLADAGKQTVLMVGPDGSSRLLGEGALKEPTAVAVLPDGGLLVLDAGAGAVYRLGRDGKLGDRLFADFPLYGPRGLTVGPGGQVVLTDTGNGRLLAGPPGGTPVNVPGLAQPTAAIMLGDGTFLVAETGAGRIVQVGADGKRLASWTMAPSTTVSGPQVAALPNGGWVASSPDAHAVVVRRDASAPVELHGVGAARRPTGVAADAKGQLVVVDTAGSAVRAFAQP
jgi:DNA-binding beta-propeller fold protein YncE/4-amino-4-deoxy-L-arabinose transferase-like glycosyltransferase